MMARRVAVQVAFEVLGVELGHWCNHCMLPSGIRILYVNHIGQSMCFHFATSCRDHDHDDVELIEHPTIVWAT